METLPIELAKIAESVSLEKRSEVQEVLNSVFENISKIKEQLDFVVVANENDNENMKIASEIRLSVKRIRLAAEKVFDEKREYVQSQMLGYKTEDSLWLKSKQIMQILTKEIEDSAKFKEETGVRIIAERKELETLLRAEKVAKVSDIQRREFESMSDDAFDIFLNGLQKKHAEKLEAEAKAEAERIEKAVAHEKEKKRLSIENEKLKAEAEIKAKELKEAKAKLDEEINKKLKAEAEIKAKELKEAKAKEAELKAKLKAEKKAAAAPDKEKLASFAKSLLLLEIPEMKTEETKKIASDIAVLLAKIHTFIFDKLENGDI